MNDSPPGERPHDSPDKNTVTPNQSLDGVAVGNPENGNRENVNSTFEKDNPENAFHQLPWWTRLQAMAIYYPTLAYNVLIGRVLGWRPWWTRIDEYLIVGALPFTADAAKLHAEGVRGVINTCIEYAGPTEEYERLGIEQLWVPTVDFTHPSLETVRRGVDFLQSHANRGHTVYVHCKAGRARSATIAACWLMQSRGWTAEQAQDLLLKKRPHVNPRLAQRPVVQEFARQLTDQ